MTDSSIANSDQPACYISNSPTDQCSSTISYSDTFSDGLNYCCGAGVSIQDNVLNFHYSSNGAVDCQACELLFKSIY